MAPQDTAPVLSTPAAHTFEEQPNFISNGGLPRISDDKFNVIYEISRTLEEIRKGKYARVALQFPDKMLPDAPRVFEALSKGLDSTSQAPDPKFNHVEDLNIRTENLSRLSFSPETRPSVRLYILADTSYGACCVDEIAAEHINADAVVHYGRACLSPTARIPVIHIFTVQPLPERRWQWAEDFENFYKDKRQRIILMADVTFQSHLGYMQAALRLRGYEDLYMTEISHGPSSPLPNRTAPDEVKLDPTKLRNWHIFYVSDPPDSLLLILASRVASIRIIPTTNTDQDSSCEPFIASTSRALNRRYALLTSVATVSIFGILINTLSVKNYLHIVEHVKSQILNAGKKSYTFVVGKVNAAKVANFSEIGAWVVIGCWESSLIDSKDFWKPVLTPFELDLALKGDRERVWTGEWSSDFQTILDGPKGPQENASNGRGSELEANGTEGGDFDSEPESTPPEYDLRTGRYVSHSRPMHVSGNDSNSSGNGDASNALIQRANGDLAMIGGEASPGAEHLRSKRTWKGLGSDFEIAYEEAGMAVEEGRRGIARGYAHGVDKAKT